jgi:hypothetical protein
MVIPAMDHIDATFTNGIIQKEPLHPAIRAAVQLAKKTLNRYYSLTDSSEVYRIAMGTFLQNYRTILLLKTSPYSSPPTTQTALFQDSWMGCRVDRNGRKHCS